MKLSVLWFGISIALVAIAWKFLFDQQQEVSLLCDSLCLHEASQIGEYNGLGYQSIEPCSVIDLSNHSVDSAARVLKNLQKSRQVAILRNSPILGQWKAFSLWNSRSYWIRNVPKLHNIRIGSDKLFVYQDWDRPMAKSRILTEKQVIDKKLKKLANMSMTEFMDRIVKKGTQEYMYYSHNLLHPLGLASIASDVFHKDDKLVNIAGKDESLVNVWIGAAGIVAQAHYDPTDNVFAQLVGVKRFILSPPSNWNSLYIHPFAHPRHRQSQVNFTNPEKHLRNSAKRKQFLLLCSLAIFCIFHHTGSIALKQSRPASASMHGQNLEQERF